MDPKLIVVKGDRLRTGDRIYHPTKDGWRLVYEVVKEPYARPGTWSLSCECRDAAGKKTRISVGPTEPLDIERKVSV